MNKLNLSEIICYGLLYGLSLIILPYVVIYVFGIIFSFFLPAAISNEGELSGSLLGGAFDAFRIIVPIVLFIAYYFFSNKIFKYFGKPNILIFVVVFIISGALNLYINNFICQISVLMRCDPAELYTLKGLYEMYFNYGIVLLAFVISSIVFKNKIENSKI